jgi:uncharacterized membrane protein
MVGITLFAGPASALEVGDVTVAPDKTVKNGRPLDLVSFILTYTNSDGIDDAYMDNFRITPIFPPSSTDWNATISFSGGRLYVPRNNGQGDATLFIRVAKTAAYATTKQFTVKADAETQLGAVAEANITATVTISVTQHWELSLTNLTGESDTKKPGSNNRVFFNMTVNNTGNGQDSVSFSAIGSPGDPPSFTPSTPVEAFSTSTYKMSISNIPNDISRGDHVVTVTVTSENSSVTAQYDFIVTVDPYYELELDLNETTSTKTIQPGSDITFNFIIDNKGNGKEKLNFDVGLIGNPSFWGTNVYPFSGATVEKNSYRDVKVTITAPNNATYPTNLDVYLNVSSQNEPTVYQYTTVQVKLAQVQDVDIIVPSSKNLNDTTRQASFPITVQNKGNGEDTFEFSVTGTFPVGELWNFDFSPNSITLDSKYSSNNEGTVYLNFTAPEDAGYGSFQVTVNSFSSSDSGVKDSSNITIIVGKLRNIALFRQVNEKQAAYPGDNVSIKFLGENTGNFVDTFYLSMNGPPATADWDFNFDPGLFSNLQPDASQFGYLNISVDKDALEAYYIITVRAESANDNTKFDEFTINISVRQKFEIELSTTSTTESTDVGVPASFKFTIRNRGTGSSNVTMSKTMSPEISGYMNVKITPTTFELTTPADDQVVWVNITPSDSSPLAPMNVTTGVPITITADIDERDGGPEEVELIYVKVNQTYDVQVWPDALEKTVKPGKTINFSLEIRNTGNGPDSFSIKTSSVLVTWSASLSTPNTKTLAMDGIETVIMSVQVPINEVRDHDNITINVSSRNAQSDGLDVYQMEMITVNVRSPVTGLNFTIRDGTRTKTLNPGSTVLFNLSATNTGVDVDKFTFETSFTNQNLVKEWSMSLQTTDWLVPEESVDFQLSFTLKNDAASDYVNITLSGTSKNNANNIERYALSILVNPIFQVKVTYTATNPIPPNKAMPGTNATFQIKVKNEGTALDIMELEIEENYADITALFTDYSLIIGAGGSQTAQLIVIIPDEPSTLDLTIKVTATSQKDDDSPAAADFVNVVFSIDPTRDVDVSATKTDLEITPNLEGSKASIDYAITVTNKGKDKDSFTIAVGVDNTYRSWFSYPTETAKIAEDTATTVTVTIEVPNGRAPETFQFTVTATSTENTDKSAMETFTLKILEAYGIDLEAKDKKDKKSTETDSRESGNNRLVDFELEVINVGTSLDNYDIVAIESTHSNWVTISPARITSLSAGLTEVVTVTIKIPKDTPIGDIKLQIKATSRGDDDVFDTADESDTQDIWVTVTQIYDVDIVAPTTLDNGKPGERIEFKFTVKNRGNGEDSILLKLEDKQENWPWTLSTSAPTLQAAGDASGLDSRDVILTVIIPNDAEVRSIGYTVNVVMESESADEETIYVDMGDLVYKVEVDQDYEVRMEVNKKQEDGDPGDTISYKIRVENEGNGPDIFDLEATKEKSKDNVLPLFTTELSTEVVHLNAFDFVYVYLNISIPSINDFDTDNLEDLEKIQADDYPVTVHARSRGEDVDHKLNLTVSINKKYRLEITANDPRPSNDPLEATADDPDGTKFFVTVMNTGNADNTATLSALDNEPDEWIFNFRVDDAPTKTLSLEPGETQRVQVIVTFGEDVLPTDVPDYAGVTVKSSRNNQKYGLSLNDRVYIDVQIYQLKIDTIEFSEKPAVGKKISIKATITNVGKGDAEDIVVKFLDGSATLKSEKVDKIKAGETEVVTIEWDVSEGDHKIGVEVEQFDGTKSTEETSVTAEKQLLTPQMQNIALALVIIFGLLFALMAAFTVRRRRELPPDIKAELSKLRKESDMRRGRRDLEKSSELDSAAAGKDLALPGSAAGRFKELPPGPDDLESETPRKAVKIKCPKCDRIQTVPSPKRPLEFDCDDCGQKLVLRKK